MSVGVGPRIVQFYSRILNAYMKVFNIIYDHFPLYR